MVASEHDLLVIGAGPAGYVAAIRAAQLGMNVACVEQEQALGGTCLRVGCIPSKALLESSQHFVQAKQQLAAHGVVTGEVNLDLAAMHRRKDRIVASLTRGVAFLFKKNKVTLYQGAARLVGSRRVVVEGSRPAELEAKHVLVASASSLAPRHSRSSRCLAG
jgi:dihydrolipoamide dehydrogenase